MRFIIDEDVNEAAASSSNFKRLPYMVGFSLVSYEILASLSLYTANEMTSKMISAKGCSK